MIDIDGPMGSGILAKFGLGQAGKQSIPVGDQEPVLISLQGPIVWFRELLQSV